MALIDIDYFNAQSNTLGLKTSFTPPTDVLTVLLDEASEWVEGYCRRRFGTLTLTEDHWGKGSTKLLLNEFPVASVTSISAVNKSGAATDDAPATNDVRILTRAGILELKDASLEWSKDRLYTVEYTMTAEVPGPVKRATALKVVELLEPQYFPGKARNVELITNVQEQMVTLLEDFRRERIG